MPKLGARPPRGVGKAAAIAVGIIAAMIVVIFVGFNLYRTDTLREVQSGEVDPRDAPKSPTDLQAPRPRP